MRAKKVLFLVVILSLLAAACATTTTLTQSREEYVKAHPNLDPKTKASPSAVRTLPTPMSS